MRIATLNRMPSTDEGTFGKFLLDDGWGCFSGELPWRENQKGLSSIPPGAYNCQWLLSPTHGWCYHITGVPGRSEIEIHAANFCGDRQLAKKCDLRGCIALGLGLGALSGQVALLQSRDAIQELHRQLQQAPLQLVIHASLSR